MTKASILSNAAIAVLIGTMTVVTAANGASMPSSPEERAATAALNRKSLADTAAAEWREKQLQAQYEEQLKQQKSQFDEQKRIWEKQQEGDLAELKNDRVVLLTFDIRLDVTWGASAAHRGPASAALAPNDEKLSKPLFQPSRAPASRNTAPPELASNAAEG